MRRRVLIQSGLLAGASAVLATTALAGSTGRWKMLFNGHSLCGWRPVGDANWTLNDGAVKADAGNGGFLVSEASFGDVQIRAEFWVSDDANSGIFVRCTNPLVIGLVSAYEMNIYDTRPDPTYGTGSIVGVAAVSPMPKAGGHWNTMDITARGDRFSIVFNGQRTVDDVQDNRFSHGRIALQYGQGVVKFRKVLVRSL